MSLRLKLNKKGKQFSSQANDFHKPSAHNPIYQIELPFLGCPYDSDKKGRQKNFQTLWKLYMHVRLNHKNESDNFKSVIWNLADYVMRGILK